MESSLSTLYTLLPRSSLFFSFLHVPLNLFRLHRVFFIVHDLGPGLYVPFVGIYVIASDSALYDVSGHHGLTFISYIASRVVDMNRMIQKDLVWEDIGCLYACISASFNASIREAHCVSNTRSITYASQPQSFQK